MPEALQRLGRRLAAMRAEQGRRANQRTGLVDVHEFKRADVELQPDRGQIDGLSAGHPARARCRGKQRQHFQLARRRDARKARGKLLERQGLQGVTDQQGGRLVVCDMTTGLAAAHVVIVHARHVVMDQGIGVDQLDGRRRGVKDFGGRAEYRSGGVTKQRTYALAAAKDGVTHGLVQARRRNVGAGQGGFEVDGFAITPLGRPGRQHLMWPLKRAFDVAVSGFVLLAVSPVYLACALAVKLTSPGPVYFRQVRVSVDHVPFDILKFRTMKYVADPQKQAELDQRAQAVNLDDDRITPIGKFLRKSHLDELPQLLNVLKGEMSIVGPRPERPYFVDQHTATIEGYAHRHRVPAGITGWAQVNGFWGDSSLEARVRLDNRYIENWTPWRDLVIGLRTIPTLLGKRR